MAEIQEERTSSGGSVFTRKLGALPLWAWMGIGLAVALGYFYWKQNKAKSSSSAGSNMSVQTANGTVSAAQIPQFVNQVYDTNTPPSVNISTPVTVSAPAQPSVPAAPSPVTISGAPGSYTTNLGGNNTSLNEWTSTGDYSLNTIAKSHGLTPNQLAQVSLGAQNNPMLQAYIKKGNFNANIPAGTELFIPKANWGLVSSS